MHRETHKLRTKFPSTTPSSWQICPQRSGTSFKELCGSWPRFGTHLFPVKKGRAPLHWQQPWLSLGAESGFLLSRLCNLPFPSKSRGGMGRGCVFLAGKDVSRVRNTEIFHQCFSPRTWFIPQVGAEISFSLWHRGGDRTHTPSTQGGLLWCFYPTAGRAGICRVRVCSFLGKALNLWTLDSSDWIYLGCIKDMLSCDSPHALSVESFSMLSFLWDHSICSSLAHLSARGISTCCFSCLISPLGWALPFLIGLCLSPYPRCQILSIWELSGNETDISKHLKMVSFFIWVLLCGILLWVSFLTDLDILGFRHFNL